MSGFALIIIAAVGWFLLGAGSFPPGLEILRTVHMRAAEILFACSFALIFLRRKNFGLAKMGAVSALVFLCVGLAYGVRFGYLYSPGFEPIGFPVPSPFGTTNHWHGSDFPADERADVE